MIIVHLIYFESKDNGCNLVGYAANYVLKITLYTNILTFHSNNKYSLVLGFF